MLFTELQLKRDKLELWVLFHNFNGNKLIQFVDV